MNIYILFKQIKIIFLSMSYHAWYSEKMALNQSVFIYRKSSIYEHGAYATLLTNSDKIDNSGYDDIQYVGIVHLQDFIQNITQPSNWIIKRIRLNYESQKK